MTKAKHLPILCMQSFVKKITIILNLFCNVIVNQNLIFNSSCYIVTLTWSKRFQYQYNYVSWHDIWILSFRYIQMTDKLSEIMELGQIVKINVLLITAYSFPCRQFWLTLRLIIGIKIICDTNLIYCLIKI